MNDHTPEPYGSLLHRSLVGDSIFVLLNGLEVEFAIVMVEGEEVHVKVRAPKSVFIRCEDRSPKRGHTRSKVRS